MISLSEPLSVKQLSDILQGCFSNPAFSNLSVYGEVYSIKLGKFSYIEIGDQGNRQTSSPIVKCAFSTFYHSDYHLEEIKVGDVIQVRGSLSYYPHGCSITLWGKEVNILQSQLGKNLLLKQKILKKLDSLGYLDPKRKKPIPRYVKKVAILTAQSGAAYQDILKTLHERFPVSTVLYPITVQGENAARSIVKALERAKKDDSDIILLGRGGGSKSDLSCFDDEKVALAIATSEKPVITSIGHTIDTSIADRVSDRMAITPTEGASLINPSLEEIREAREDYLLRLTESFVRRVEEKRRNLALYGTRLDSLSPKSRISVKRKELQERKKDMEHSFLNRIALLDSAISRYRVDLIHVIRDNLNRKRMDLKGFTSVLEVHNPTFAEKNGYAVLFKDGKKVYSAKELSAGDRVTITYSDGKKEATIKEKTK